MRAYAALGDSNGVRKAYKMCKVALRRELDAEPSSETKRLYQKLLCQQPPA